MPFDQNSRPEWTVNRFSTGQLYLQKSCCFAFFFLPFLLCPHVFLWGFLFISVTGFTVYWLSHAKPTLISAVLQEVWSVTLPALNWRFNLDVSEESHLCYTSVHSEKCWAKNNPICYWVGLLVWPRTLGKDNSPKIGLNWPVFTAEANIQNWLKTQHPSQGLYYH